MIAWELGGNFGHVARCMRIALALRERGHQVLFATRDLSTAVESLSEHKIACCQAPIRHQPATLSVPPVNYSEILLGEGYGNADTLRGLVNGWMGLLDLHGSDVLLADHAPTALLAAHAMRIPHVAIGNGFSIPPKRNPLPSIRPWEDIPEERLVAADQRLQSSLGRLMTSLGVPHEVTLQDLFRDSLLDTFPELVHFGERAEDKYIGPIFGFSNGLRLSWQHCDAKKILLYVRPETPGFVALMDALSTTAAEKICIVPGLRGKDGRRFASQWTRVALKPVALGPLLQDADLMICQGGAGTMSEALLSGTPLLIVPAQVEQCLAGAEVERAGMGGSMGTQRAADNFKQSIARLLEGADYRRKVTAFAHLYAGFHPDQAIAATVEMLESKATR